MQDWFVVDMEHSPNELNDVLLQLQAKPVRALAWRGELETEKKKRKAMPMAHQYIILETSYAHL